jgi:uncharacterized BrkB/YihY/UPF0761 family membrane protein
VWAWLFASYTATFGAIGGFIALMTWLYVSAIAILLGAELDAAIEKASLHAGRRHRAPAHPRPTTRMARHIARHRFSRPAMSEALRPPAESASRDSSD